jgi:glycosyltransferase involved in cell wall biosynthesis
MKDHIVIVGASSIHTIRYINGISTKFNKIIFITNHSNNLSLPDNTIIYNVNFKLLSFLTPWRIAKILKTHYNTNATNIIHIHQANSYAYHAIRAIKLSKLKYKIILTAWGSDILLLPKQNILFKCLVKYNLSNADIITAGSLYMINQIKQLSPQAKNLYAINFGVKDFPLHLDLSHKENIILSNRLHKNLYNIDKIIMSFSKLIKNQLYLDYQLVIAGNGCETSNLENLVKNLGIEDHVRFIGMVDYITLQNWYKRTKLFVSIPDSDSASLSSLEAMSFGCYPLLSNLPASIEYIIDGINGTICPDLESLHLNMEGSLKLISISTEHERIAQFNYNLVQQKAVFNTNILKFIELY